MLIYLALSIPRCTVPFEVCHLSCHLLVLIRDYVWRYRNRPIFAAVYQFLPIIKKIAPENKNSEQILCLIAITLTSAKLEQ